MEKVEVLIEDLHLIEQVARFHFFHRWSKWYRVSIKIYEGSDFFSFVRQQRHCLICNRIQRVDIGGQQ